MCKASYASKTLQYPADDVTTKHHMLVDITAHIAICEQWHGTENILSFVKYP
jgi:hypothetical protein